jgi:hypothetical protein
MAPARITKRSLDFAAAFGIDLAPQPHGLWEGGFVQTTSTPNESYFLRAAIGMSGSALQGEGYLSPDATGNHHIEADISGSVHGRRVSFAVWVRTEQRFEPFTCAATIDARTGVIRGSWRHPCYRGEGCNCEGGGGNFELRRICD